MKSLLNEYLTGDCYTPVVIMTLSFFCKYQACSISTFNQRQVAPAMKM